MKAQEIWEVVAQFNILSDYAYSIGQKDLADRYNTVSNWLELKAIKAEHSEKVNAYNEYFQTHTYDED